MPYTPLAKPALGATVTDPDFGSKITRITDAQSQFGKRNCVVVYSTAQAWNCDESFMILYVQDPNGSPGHALFNGQAPYNFISYLNGFNPSDVEQFWWHPTNPNLVYVFHNYRMGSTPHAELVLYDVTKRAVNSIVFDFIPLQQKMGWPSGQIRAGYPNRPGASKPGANDYEVWGLGSGGIPNVNSYLGLNVFGWRMSDPMNPILYQNPPIALAQQRNTVPSPARSGNGWVWNDLSHGTFTGTVDIVNLSGKVINKVPVSGNEHGAFTSNRNNDDLFISAQFDTAVQGTMVRANLTTGKVDLIAGAANGYGYTRLGTFLSSTCNSAPWLMAGAATGYPYGTDPDNLGGGFGSPQAKPVTLLDQEIWLTDVDTGIVRRVAHHRTTGNYSNARQNNYWAQPNICISPSGTRAIFCSDWGNANPSNPVIDPNASTDTYLISFA